MKRFAVAALFIIFACFICQNLLAQSINLGIPPIRNFTKKDYQAGTQNWDAAQDARGVMFFANNEGLLEFDGSHWFCHPVANRTVVRSVAIDSRGRIFVGAQNEFGYFFPEKNGQLRYHSLVKLLPPEYQYFADVWDIICHENVVFFRTKRSIFQFSNENITCLTADNDLTAMFSTPLGMVVQQNFSDILLIEKGTLRPLFHLPALQSEITGKMQWLGDTLLFSSLKNGFFYLVGNQFGRWQTPHDAIFQQKRIYAATQLPNGHLALGTSLDGWLEIDLELRIFRHLNKKNGLQNNNILHVFADRTGNVWLGLDNGIDLVVLTSPFSSVIPDGDLHGTGYAAAIFQGNLYLGVSNGVYRTPWKSYFNPEKPSFFEKIPSTDGQVWSLVAMPDELLLGHHEGSFSLLGQSCRRMAGEAGAWKFIQLDDQFLLGGNYAGLVLYRKEGGKWFFDQKLIGLNESCRFMVRDADGAVWVAHPYLGLFRVEWSAARKHELQVAFFNSKHGLPSDLNNFVFSIAGKAVFATERGIFRFDKHRQTFVPDEDFEQFLGDNTPIRYLHQDETGNIWFVAGKTVGVLEVDDLGLKKAIRKRIFPELNDRLVGGFEFILPIDRQNVLFGAEHGFIHFDTQKNNPLDTIFHVVLSQVLASGGGRDSVVFGGYSTQNGQVLGHPPLELSILDAEMNSLRFVFAAARFDEPTLIEYRYRLRGLSDAWSDWSNETIQQFAHLRPGNYHFEVHARRKNGNESQITTFAFRIRPPWYASPLAFGVYALAVLFLFVGFLMQQRRKFDREKQHLTVQHQQITAEQQREVEQSKAALTDVLKEKLEAEIQFKNKELASATMHLVQKGEILLTIHDNLNQILEKSSNPVVKKEIQQLLNLLNFDAKLDEDWEQFAQHFDQVHVNFLQRLRERFPQLSPTDIKLCAYLRMNLTTKEIAPLMNVSVRGVEASRYRLRKKLDLPGEVNLTDFIANI